MTKSEIDICSQAIVAERIGFINACRIQSRVNEIVKSLMKLSKPISNSKPESEKKWYDHPDSLKITP